jgi:hypothetical protein
MMLVRSSAMTKESPSSTSRRLESHASTFITTFVVDTRAHRSPALQEHIHAHCPRGKCMILERAKPVPSLDEHVRRSAERTGQGYRELNEWLDGDSVPLLQRLRRHLDQEIFEVC